jgi:hypothetical protein
VLLGGDTSPAASVSFTLHVIFRCVKGVDPESHGSSTDVRVADRRPVLGRLILPMQLPVPQTVIESAAMASPQPRRNLFVPLQAAAKPIALKQLWEAIPQPSRQRTLQALGRLVAQQLQTTSRRKGGAS